MNDWKHDKPEPAKEKAAAGLARPAPAVFPWLAGTARTDDDNAGAAPESSPPPPLRPGRAKSRSWTDAELETAAQEDLAAGEIAWLTGRSYEDVSRKRRTLGVCSPQPSRARSAVTSVLEAIMNKRPGTMAWPQQICELTGHPRATVGIVLGKLLGNGWVTERLEDPPGLDGTLRRFYSVTPAGRAGYQALRDGLAGTPRMPETGAGEDQA